MKAFAARRSPPYRTIADGEGMDFPADTIHRFACCDCGLIHDFVLSVSRDRKTVGLAVRRNARATAQRRLGMRRRAAR